MCTINIAPVNIFVRFWLVFFWHLCEIFHRIWIARSKAIQKCCTNYRHTSEYCRFGVRLPQKSKYHNKVSHNLFADEMSCLQFKQKNKNLWNTIKWTTINEAYLYCHQNSINNLLNLVCMVEEKTIASIYIYIKEVENLCKLTIFISLSKNCHPTCPYPWLIYLFLLIIVFSLISKNSLF